VSAPFAVLHVDPERGLGGGERQVLGLLARLRDHGIRQTLAADPGGRLAPAAERLGVAVAPLRIRNHLDLLAGRRLARLLARERYAIVHFHTARAHAMAAFLGRARDTARVVTRRMDYRLRGGWYTRRLYNHEVQAVVAISEGVRAALIASGIDPARIHVVPSGVDADAFAPSATSRAAIRAQYEVAPETRVLAVVGALEPRKGHDLLLAALATLPALPLAVWCAGTGSARAALEAQCRALGLERTVRFLGRVDDVPGLLAGADALVMPSRREGLGVAVLEAMAAGLPVIASRVGGLPEAVVDGETGLLVTPEDVAALAAAIARLARDRALADRLGTAGAARVRAHFTMSTMADATLAVYRRLVPQAAGTEAAPGAH
jgi:glycosyltransferase involved in cell wall biosynthesis